MSICTPVCVCVCVLLCYFKAQRIKTKTQEQQQHLSTYLEYVALIRGILRRTCVGVHAQIAQNLCIYVHTYYTMHV
jgi:hypothetical protein